MKTQESNIVGLVILDLLTEREHKALKILLETEVNYQIFLTKLLEILIGKENNISLNDFLELHNLNGKDSEFQESISSIIEDIAELSSKGFSSEYTKWFEDNQNRIYLDHLTFAKEIKKGFEIKERIAIKDRLLLIDKMKDFDVSDDELRVGLTILERRRLKQRFAEIDTAQESYYSKEKKGFFQLKFATIVLLITISGAILAFSIPGFRNFIQKEFKELFQKEVPPIKKENDAVIAPKAITSDTLVNNIDTTINNATNVQTEDAPVTEEKKEKETVIAPTKTAILLEGFVSNNDANSSDYWNYFRRHKLDNIEGLWKWTCTKRTHINLVLADTLPLFCAIREIEDKKYEIAFFQENGNRVHPSYVSIITKKINNNKYELSQYQNEKHPIIKNIYLSDEGELKFNAYFILSDFQNFAGKVNKGEWSEYTVIGKKK